MAVPLTMKRLGALALVAGLGACTTALHAPAPPIPAPVLHSVAEADRTLEMAAARRSAFEAEYAASERFCYTKFAVTRCLDNAKEKRRAGLAELRVIEVEASFYKRKAAVEERDRALAESSRMAEEQEAVRRAAPPKVVREANVEAPKTPPRADPNRAARHAVKEAQKQRQEQAGAAKRAANVAAFEQKRLDSEQRQRDVAAKKAEKAAKEASTPPAK